MTDQILAGRHVLITGGGSGIGEATAYEVAGLGAAVTLIGRSASRLRSVAEKIESAGGTARTAAVDVTDAVAIRAAVAAADDFAPLWGCVNSAGFNRPGATIGYAIEDFDALMATAVRGTFLVSQAVGERLVGRGEGRIVAVSSQMGTVGYPGRAAYCTSKAAIDGMTRALAVEWAPFGVTVNAVAPTFVETPMTEKMFSDEAFYTDVLGRIPRGSLGTLDEVVVAISFLLSPRASLVNGHVMLVDGGWTAW
jgi:NAD(P)-dependent dehydrogenase (short-subunit alcohol dehydrogenase family)